MGEQELPTCTGTKGMLSERKEQHRQQTQRQESMWQLREGLRDWNISGTKSVMDKVATVNKS